MLSVVLSEAEGYRGDEPILTRRPVVGAGVGNIRTRVIGRRRGRCMVKAFWNATAGSARSSG